jgi:phosphate transport system substrate-binding protein
MSSRSIKRFARATVGGVAVLSAVVLAACDYSPDGDPDVIAIAGSDTTQDVMRGIVEDYNADTTYNNDEDNPADDRDILRNVLSQQAPALNVPADEHCGSITYDTPPGAGEVASPNGSSAGRNALRASVLAGDGCIDVARSSGPPRAINPSTGDLATFEYYAFALDAVGWSTASTQAPNNLTLAQLRGIYNCTFDNWNEVGGTAGPIQRYYPQSGSGTQQFFRDAILGFDPLPISTPTCPAPIVTQENTGALIDANNHEQSALMPYSGANWVAQARGTAPEQRSGQVIKNLDGQNITRFDDGQWELNAEDTEFPAAPVRESNVPAVDPTPAYVGIRFVYNVVDSTSVSYESALRYVGFDNVADGSTSPLCSGALTTTDTVTSLGFGRLTGATGPTNLAGSLCRFYTPV